jgi:hypothetical protein
LNEALDVVSDLQYDLDGLWKCQDYPANRMENVVEILTSHILQLIQRTVPTTDLFMDGLLDQFNSAQQICQSWTSTLTFLTAQSWKSFKLNPWKQPPFIPKPLLLLSKRLERLVDIKVFLEKTSVLLSAEGWTVDKLRDACFPFQSLNILQCNYYSETLWESALEGFYQNLIPVERKIAQVLCYNFIPLHEHPQQLMREIQRQQVFLKRPFISEQLKEEKSILLKLLLDELKETTNRFRIFSSQLQSGPVETMIHVGHLIHLVRTS